MPLKKLRDLPRRAFSDGRKSVSHAIIDTSVADRAVAYLDDTLGLSTDSSKRTINPRLPEDLTALGDRELGKLAGQMTAMGQWLEEQLALADIEHTAHEAHLEQLKARVRLEVTGTVPDKAAKVEADPRVIAAVNETFLKEATFKLLRAKLRGYDKAYTALSREQTRREMERNAR